MRSRAARRARDPRRKPSISSVGQLLEEEAETLAPLGGNPFDELSPVVAERHADDASVLVVAPALDEAALLHAVHDPGRARLGDVERLREGAHRQRAVDLEDREDVEVHEAERTRGPPAHVAQDAGGSVDGELVEEGTHEGVAVRRAGRARSAVPGGGGRGGCACHACPQCVVDDQCGMKDSVPRGAPSTGERPAPTAGQRRREHDRRRFCPKHHPYPVARPHARCRARRERRPPDSVHLAPASSHATPSRETAADTGRRPRAGRAGARRDKARPSRSRHDPVRDAATQRNRDCPPR